MHINNAATMQLESIAGNASVAEAADRMKASNVGLLLVADGPRMIGVVTDRDIVTRAVTAKKDLAVMPVREVMSHPVVCVHGDADLNVAGKLMTMNRIRRLVVTNAENQPVGVLSIDDIAFSTHGDDTAGWVLDEIAQGPQAAAIFRRG